MKRKYIVAASLLSAMSVMSQSTVFGDKEWECSISPSGTLEHIVFKGNAHNDTVPFFIDKGNAGPAFYVNMGEADEVAAWIPDGHNSFRADIGGVECRMTYRKWHGCPAIDIEMENKGNVTFQPVKAGLKLGVDTYMDKYPQWFGKYFPTLMMNDKTHFYGYMQTPSGSLLGIVSPDAVASWSVDYNLGYQDPAPHWFMGHRIESLNLDLLNALPLPERCPQDLWQLGKGEKKKWTIAFAPISSLDSFEERMHDIAGIPMLRIDRTACRPGETLVFEVVAKDPEIEVTDGDGKPVAVQVAAKGHDVYEVSCVLPATGLYTVKAASDGFVAEGVLSANATWADTMKAARKAAGKYHQKATSHIESWYGYHSAFLAARYFPDKALDEPLKNRFEYLFGLLHDADKMEPRYYASRVQNTSGTIGMLVDKYQAFGDINDIERASRLADWLIANWQREDGAYVNHNVVYTSVIYVAESILELTLAERELAKNDPQWQQKADRHYASAKRAIDQLVASQGNFETEGEMTFEDGMISCSALQIGMLALMQDDAAERERYTKAMMEVLDSHDCLTQLKVPDARRRGGTMRYWEAQYDVQMLPNMFNSPHGWSAWRAYATYYAYLLTGSERWLRETFNAMGAFSNLIDYRDGDLRWAFVIDPYLRVTQACSPDSHFTADSLSFGNPHPELYDTRRFVIGEQYVPMVSDWQTVNTQDNDVHEVFKCIGEAVLTNAFIIERPDGTIVGYNCSVNPRGDVIEVKAPEKQITNLHANLQSPATIVFSGQKKRVPEKFMGWAFGGL